MATPTGPSLELATLRREFSTLRKDIEQIKRQVSRQPRIPVPTSGGIVGVTRCEAWSFGTQVSSGQTGIGVTEWGITSLFGTPGAGVTASSGTYPSIVIGAAGVYGFTASWQQAWSSVDGPAPTYFSVTMPYSSSPEPGFYEPTAEAYPAPKPPNVEVHQPLTLGPFPFPAGATIDLNATWNNTTPHNGVSAHVDVTRWA